MLLMFTNNFTIKIIITIFAFNNAIENHTLGIFKDVVKYQKYNMPFVVFENMLEKEYSLEPDNDPNTFSPVYISETQEMPPL